MPVGAKSLYRSQALRAACPWRESCNRTHNMPNQIHCTGSATTSGQKGSGKSVVKLVARFDVVTAMTASKLLTLQGHSLDGLLRSRGTIPRAIP